MLGKTLACGTGACASVVSSFLNGLITNKARVGLEGGSLDVELDDNLNIFMTGDAVTVYEGKIDF